LTVHHWYK